jgi:hypothetical protein
MTAPPLRRNARDAGSLIGNWQQVTRDFDRVQPLRSFGPSGLPTLQPLLCLTSDAVVFQHRQLDELDNLRIHGRRSRKRSPRPLSFSPRQLLQLHHRRDCADHRRLFRPIRRSATWPPKARRCSEATTARRGSRGTGERTIDHDAILHDIRGVHEKGHSHI